MCLQGWGVIITGGAQGIDNSTALLLLREGMNVLIADVAADAGLITGRDLIVEGGVNKRAVYR